MHIIFHVGAAQGRRRPYRPCWKSADAGWIGGNLLTEGAIHRTCKRQ